MVLGWPAVGRPGLNLRTGRARSSLSLSLLLLLPFSKSWHQALLREYCDVSGYLCGPAEGDADQQDGCAGRAPVVRVVPLVRLAVGLWPSGPTRFKNARAWRP